MTLNSAKMHQDVGGEAEKRILAKMRELVERPDAPAHVPSGEQPFGRHTSQHLHC